MLAHIMGTGRVVELLRKGTTIRTGHWHTYHTKEGPRKVFVTDHPMNYREGMGDSRISSLQRKDKESPQQGTLFELTQAFHKKHAPRVKLVLPARSGANLQQLGLFDKREESPAAEEKPGTQTAHMTFHEISGPMVRARMLVSSASPIESKGIDLSREKGTLSGARYEHLVDQDEADEMMKKIKESGGTVQWGPGIHREHLTLALQRHNVHQEAKPPVVKVGLQVTKPQKEPWEMTRTELQEAVEQGKYDAMMGTGRKLSEYMRYKKHAQGTAAVSEATRRLGFHLDQHHSSAVTLAHTQGKDVPWQVLGGYGLSKDTPKEKTVRLMLRSKPRQAMAKGVFSMPLSRIYRVAA